MTSNLTKMLAPIVIGAALISGCAQGQSKREIKPLEIYSEPVGKYDHINNQLVTDLIKIHVDKFYEKKPAE